MLLFHNLHITRVSTVSGFHITTFHVKKKDSAFNCLLLPWAMVMSV